MHLKAADETGADAVVLASRFNIVSAFLDHGTRLGMTSDNATASALAFEAENSFQTITAENLRDATVASLIVYPRNRLRQFTELKVKAKVGG